jgi:hypothetical protein
VEATGDVDLREINHFFNTALPQLEHRSLNGYLLEELGHVPEPGEVFERDGVRIEVVEATDTQVIRARLRRVTLPRPPESAADAARGERPLPGEEPVVYPLPADAAGIRTDAAEGDEPADGPPRDPSSGP